MFENNKRHLSGWSKEFTLEDMKGWCGDYNKPWKREIRKYIQDRKHESVLDVGAGVCSEYYGFKDDGYNISYSATDITSRYVEYSRSKGIDITLSGMEDLPYSDEEFDGCICLDVMTHQLEYEKVIKEMLRVTKKSVIISFFKPFEEDAILGVHTSGRYRVEKTSSGTIEHRVVNTEGETICIYNFFNRLKFIEFLDSLGVKYVFKIQSENQEKTTLFIEKGWDGN